VSTADSSCQLTLGCALVHTALCQQLTVPVNWHPARPIYQTSRCTVSVTLPPNTNKLVVIEIFNFNVFMCSFLSPIGYHSDYDWGPKHTAVTDRQTDRCSRNRNVLLCVCSKAVTMEGPHNNQYNIHKAVTMEGPRNNQYNIHKPFLHFRSWIYEGNSSFLKCDSKELNVLIMRT